MNDNSRLAQDEAAFDYGIYVMTIYAVAATNLYGIIALKELAKIANDYRVGAPPMEYIMYAQNPDFIRMPGDIEADDVMKYLEMNAKTRDYVALIENRGTRYLASRDFIIISEDGEEAVVNNTKKVYHPLRKKQTKNAKIKVYQKAPKHHQKDRPCANEIVPAKWLKRGVQA